MLIEVWITILWSTSPCSVLIGESGEDKLFHDLQGRLRYSFSFFLLCTQPFLFYFNKNKCILSYRYSLLIGLLIVFSYDLNYSLKFSTVLYSNYIFSVKEGRYSSRSLTSYFNLCVVNVIVVFFCTNQYLDYFYKFSRDTPFDVLTNLYKSFYIYLPFCEVQVHILLSYENSTVESGWTRYLDIYVI